MKKPLSFIATLAFFCFAHFINVRDQVNEIKSAASSSRRAESSSARDQNTLFFVDVVQVSIHGLSQWQRHKLQKRDSLPSLVSFEAGIQSAIQPSGYYIVHPRLRANWGLFSTDFRFNYLIQESIEGPLHLRTTDWQVFQLNIVTTPAINFRLGAGILYEAYGNRDVHGEWTAAFALHPRHKRIGVGLEYRYAEVRQEVNATLNLPIASSGKWHWYATTGALFQRYYSTINVWGLQGGLNLRFY